jgi:drug/metabolite transporter (DMT)-like permease
MDRKEAAGLGYVLLAVVFFATSPILVRWAAPLSPFAIAFGRLASAALIVLLAERLSHVPKKRALLASEPGEIGLCTPPRSTGESPIDGLSTLPVLRSAVRSPVVRFALYGLVAALHFLFYIASLSYTTIAHSLAIVYTAPVFVTLFAAVLLNEKIRARQWLGLPVVVVGIAILAGFEPRMDSQMLFGDLLALGSAICFGLYSVAGRRERAAYPLLRYAGLVYLAAALWLLPAAIVGGIGQVEVGSLAAVVALGVFPLAIGHTLYNASLRRVHPTYVNLVSTQEVTIGVLLGYLLLGEAPGPSSLVGGGLSLIGVALVLLL